MRAGDVSAEAEAPRRRDEPLSVAAGRAEAARGLRGTGRASGRVRRALRGTWDFLTRPRGNRTWDAVIRGTGVLGLLGVGLVLLAPAAGPLVGLGVYTIWVTGPLSPFFPIGLEPILMVFGRLYPPLLVAAASVAAGLWIEFLNYHLYGKLLGLRAARRFRESRAVGFLQRLFRRAPFFAVWVSAWTPLPFWGARVLATLSDYPIGRYLTATLLGRFPKLWFFAALGLHWGLSDVLLVGVAGGSALLATGLWLFGGRGESGVAPASRAVGGVAPASRAADGTVPVEGTTTRRAGSRARDHRPTAGGDAVPA